MNYTVCVRRVIGSVLLNFSVCGTTRLSQYIFPLVGPGRIIGLQGTDTFHLTDSGSAAPQGLEALLISTLQILLAADRALMLLP